METEYISAIILIAIILILVFYGNPFSAKETLITKVLPTTIEHTVPKTPAPRAKFMKTTREDRSEEDAAQPLRAPRISEESLKALL